MKTIADIQKEIEENALEVKRLSKDIEQRIEVKRNKTKIKRIKKANSLLKQCKLYLETNPRPEYVQEMKDEVLRKIDSIGTHFGDWLRFNATKFKNPRTTYDTQMGIKDLRNQLKTLNYLLN